MWIRNLHTFILIWLTPSPNTHLARLMWNSVMVAVWLLCWYRFARKGLAYIIVEVRYCVVWIIFWYVLYFNSGKQLDTTPQGYWKQKLTKNHLCSQKYLFHCLLCHRLSCKSSLFLKIWLKTRDYVAFTVDHVFWCYYISCGYIWSIARVVLFQKGLLGVLSLWCF